MTNPMTVPSELVDHREPCPSDFCQFFSGLNLNVKSKNFGSQLFHELQEWTKGRLTSNFPEAGGSILNVLIGTKRQLEQRTNCPSCRFFYCVIREVDLEDSWKDAGCYAKFCDTMQFTLAFLLNPSDDMEYEDQKRCGDTISFVSDTPCDASAGRVFDYHWPDMTRVRSWIQSCNNVLHGKCFEFNTQSFQRELPSLLRVFDVDRHCLTEIMWNEKYVTLSYVWGDAQPPRLLKDVLEDYMRPNAFSTLIHTFPATIRDAITLVGKLQLRYFWFDSLCLIQDDPEDLKLGIKNMDIVYERAYLTIIAANSASANSQISGISKSRSKSQDIARIKPGMELIRIASLGDALLKSKWGTRGWTLQEQQLSRRMLILANDQVYFRCRKNRWSEDTWSDWWPDQQDTGETHHDPLALTKRSMDLQESSLAFLDFFETATQIFQTRNLTVDGDAVNAMTGLLARVRQHANSEIVQGNIAAILPLLLLFLHRGLFGEERKLEGVPRRRFDFPSWSWAGWNSTSVDFHFPDWKDIDPGEDEDHKHLDLATWLRRENWIYWYASDKGSAPQLIQDPRSSSRLVSTLGPRTLYWLLSSWFREMMPKGKAFIRRICTTLDDPLQGQNSFSDADELESDNILLKIAPDYTPGEYEHRPERPVPVKNYTILVFYTFMIRLRLVPSRSGFFRDKDLYDANGTLCGRVVMDIPVSDPNCMGSCILLSERPWPDVQITPVPPWDIDWKPEDRMFWVMLIEWVGDIYERRGIGVMKGGALEAPFWPGCEWKEIHLG